MKLGSIDETRRSRPHRRVEKMLDRLNISYMSEHDVFAPYVLDVFLPEWHCAIEIDGPTHSKAKDAVRDVTLLETYGVPVLRLQAATMLAEHAEVQILEFIKRCAPSTRERKRACLSR